LFDFVRLRDDLNQGGTTGATVVKVKKKHIPCGPAENTVTVPIVMEGKMKKVISTAAITGLLTLGLSGIAWADTIHAFTGEISFILYGDGTSVNINDPTDVAASNNAGAQLQSNLGLNWITQGLGVTINAYVPDNLYQQYPPSTPDWRRYESGSSSINWSIGNGPNSVAEDGGIFSANSSTVLVWDNILDNPDGVDRYTVSSFGTVSQGTDGYFNFTIGLWENGSNGVLPGTYDFGNTTDPISNYYPDLTQIYAGTDTIRSYMYYTQGLLVEGTDEYWAKTFDAVLAIQDYLSPEDSSRAAFMVGITFDRDPAPVPVPATILLFGSGLAGLVGSRLRRKK